MTPEQLEIVPARAPRELATAAALFREYAESLPFPLDYQGFEHELATLPGKYADPGGAILIARRRGEAVGCIAMRPIEAMAGDPAPVCEMKRMYVRPTARGLGLGRLLAAALLEQARARGYRMMKLDTESDFAAAVGLYRSLGFVEIPRYNDDPMPSTMWMGLAL